MNVASLLEDYTFIHLFIFLHRYLKSNYLFQPSPHSPRINPWYGENSVKKTHTGDGGCYRIVLLGCLYHNSQTKTPKPYISHIPLTLLRRKTQLNNLKNQQTQFSRMVTHPSTNRAECCSTQNIARTMSSAPHQCFGFNYYIVCFKYSSILLKFSVIRPIKYFHFIW